MPIVRRQIHRKIPYRLIGVLLCLAVLSAGIPSFYLMAVAHERIYDGVSAGGAPLGGLDRAAARESLRQWVEQRMGDQTLDLVYGQSRRALDFAGRVQVDYDRVVDDAYRVGRDGGMLRRLPAVMGQKAEVPLLTAIDEDYFKEKITDFASVIESENSVYSFSPDGGTVTIDFSGDGVLIDADEAFSRLAQNIARNDFSDLILTARKDMGVQLAALLYHKIVREPKNARYEVVARALEITPEEDGRKVDKAALEARLSAGEQTFSLPVEAVAPDLTREDIRAALFQDVLSQYATSYNNSNPGRTRNMELSASKINNVVLAPGDIFSFNDIVGNRTYAAGYQDANVYVGGRVEQGVGGGICQVVSTLYTAQLYADLKTVTRHNHQFTVSYLPLGQDATVAWGALDYQFQNDTGAPVRIEASVTGGRHTIRILGTKKDPSVTVKIVTNTLSIKAPNERVEYSSALPAGKTVVTQAGQTGAVVDTYKVYLKDGVEKERLHLHRSSYAPMERIVQKSSLPISARDQAVPGEEDQPASGGEAPPVVDDTAERPADEFLSENGL